MGFTKGHKINVGRKVSDETKERMSIAQSKEKIKKICICGKVFNVWPSLEKRKKYCSKNCFSKSKLGRIPWNKGLIGYKSGKNHHWYGRNMSGSNSPSWIGGEKFWKKDDRRNDSGYIGFVKLVKIRDDNKCKINDKDCQGRLEVHHILSWKDYPSLRYNTNNGITLCHAHHPRGRAKEKRLVPFFMGLMSVSSRNI